MNLLMANLLIKDFVRVEEEGNANLLKLEKQCSSGLLMYVEYWRDAYNTRLQQVYDKWLKQQPEPVPEQGQLKFCEHRTENWMKEYNVSLRKPNKEYAIKKEDRISTQGLLKKHLDGKKVFYRRIRSWPTCCQRRANGFAP